MMATMDERIAALESEVAWLKQCMPGPAGPSPEPWWEQIRGAFKDDPAYVEAMRLGREWREAQPIPQPSDE